MELHAGETIGFAEDDKHAITRSPGVGLPEDQMTLKISWESSAGGPDDDREDGPDGEAPRMRNPVFPRSIRRRNWRPSRGTSSSISASLGMCSMSCLPRTSMWTSAWCRPPRSGTTTPWSPWAWAPTG
ncbi:DUF4261 domain-containing protein [Flavonifractor plautii]|nr:DUF4261 domain-containing protein [Flavonifractor plautii]